MIRMCLMAGKIFMSIFIAIFLYHGGWKVLFWCLAISLVISWLTYEPETRPKPPATHRNNRIQHPNDKSPTKTHKSTFSTPDDCEQILRAKDLPTQAHPSIFQNSLNALEARATPNKRLVLAFDISNCFVTSEKNICSSFRVESKRLLNLDYEQWKQLRDIVARYHGEDFAKGKSVVKLVPKIQFICLRLALSVLCGLDGDDVDDQAVYKLASEINRQWIWSKIATDTTTGSRLPCIKNTLGELFPEWKAAGYQPASNPLNRLLPGYETLWRVVLRGLIEVAFRNASKRKEWCSILQSFFNNPTLESLHRKHGTDHVSAADIANEALRLYPPTRRIHRHYENEDGSTAFDVAADIEELHRSTATWGPDAGVFNPSRWADPMTEERAKKAFLAFGASPFPCIAKSAQEGSLAFGVAVVALLIGELSGSLNRDRWEIKVGAGSVGEDDLLKDGVPLETTREAFASLTIESRSL